MTLSTAITSGRSPNISDRDRQFIAQAIASAKRINGAMAPEVFDFLHVLLSRVDQADAASPAVRQWIQATYGEFVLPVEIPKTSVTSNKSAEFATVYDVQKYDGSAKTYKRAIDTYDRFVDLVEESIVEAWRARKAAA